MVDLDNANDAMGKLGDSVPFPEIEEITDLSIPIDSSFDIPAYINAHFPDEASLEENMDSFISRLDTAISRLDSHLASVMRHHRLDSVKAKDLTDSSLTSLTSLQTTLQDLSKAAETAEQDVQKAIAPAEPIFNALESTAASSAALNALVSMEKAVHTLEAAAESASLDVIRADLSVFTTIRNSISTLDGLPGTTESPLRRVPPLRARAGVATETIRATMLSEFRRLSDVMSLAGQVPQAKVDDAVSRLQVACRVADAMGTEVRAEMVGTFIRQRRNAFRAAFAMDRTGFTNIDKRFGWVRKELRSNWAKLGGERIDRGWGRIFPEDWNVARSVADSVMQEVREWTSTTLDGGADRDVGAMVSALKKSKEFEIELDQRFGVNYKQDTENAEKSFAGTISESYGPWMGAYVSREDERLRGLLRELIGSEKWICEEGTVLHSATELFLIIQKSMRTCASLDIRQPLFSLHRVFKKHLSFYASSLVRHLPGVYGNALADSSTLREYVKKIQKASAIVNTAEYCASTVDKLEETMRKTVESVYSADIHFSDEREKFATVSAKGIQSVVSLLDEDLEADLKEMASQEWGTWKAVGDTSKYVQSISNKLTVSAKELSHLLSKHHFRFLLEKFSMSFIHRYREYVYNCEQMNNFGAQQILLDLAAIKSLLLGLPASVRAPVPGTYVKYVNREMGNVEAILKVILAPVDVSVDTYVTLVPNGNPHDFQRLLEIKGMLRADAAPLVLDYSRRVGPRKSQELKRQQELRIKEQKMMALKSNSPQDLGSASQADGPATSTDSTNAQADAVESVRNLFGRWGASLKDAGITDRLGQVSSQFESTTDRLRKEAAARGFRFG